MRVSGSPAGRARCSRSRPPPARASSSSSGSARRWSWLPGTRTTRAAGHRPAELLEERSGGGRAPRRAAVRAARARRRAGPAGQRPRSRPAGPGGSPGRCRDPRRWRCPGGGRRRSRCASRGQPSGAQRRTIAHPTWPTYRRANVGCAAAMTGWTASPGRLRMPGVERGAAGARERDRARLPGGGGPRRRAAAAGHGPGDADARLGRGFLRDAGRTRLPRGALRQPRHRPLDQARRRRRARPARPLPWPRATRPTASPTWRRHGRPDGPPRDRVRPRGRRLDGRDDRPDAGDRAPRAGALAGLDALDHRQPLGRYADAEGLPPMLSPAPRDREGFIERIERTSS